MRKISYVLLLLIFALVSCGNEEDKNIRDDRVEITDLEEYKAYLDYYSDITFITGMPVEGAIYPTSILEFDDLGWYKVQPREINEYVGIYISGDVYQVMLSFIENYSKNYYERYDEDIIDGDFYNLYRDIFRGYYTSVEIDGETIEEYKFSYTFKHENKNINISEYATMLGYDITYQESNLKFFKAATLESLPREIDDYVAVAFYFNQYLDVLYDYEGKINLNKIGVYHGAMYRDYTDESKNKYNELFEIDSAYLIIQNLPLYVYISCEDFYLENNFNSSFELEFVKFKISNFNNMDYITFNEYPKVLDSRFGTLDLKGHGDYSNYVKDVYVDGKIIYYGINSLINANNDVRNGYLKEARFNSYAKTDALYDMYYKPQDFIKDTGIYKSFYEVVEVHNGQVLLDVEAFEVSMLEETKWPKALMNVDLFGEITLEVYLDGNAYGDYSGINVYWKAVNDRYQLILEYDSSLIGRELEIKFSMVESLNVPYSYINFNGDTVWDALNMQYYDFFNILLS